MRYIVCALLISMIVVLAGCGGGNPHTQLPGPNDDWSIAFAIQGETSQTYVGTMHGASDSVDIHDQRAPFTTSPGDLYVTVDRADGRQYLKDYRAPILPGDTKTWQIRVPGSGSKVTLCAWNPVEHDINQYTSAVLRDQSGKILWTFSTNRNGTASEPAYAIMVDSGTVLTLEVEMVNPSS